MIKIIADTSSCIPPNQAKQLGIDYIPQIIIFGEETYRDDTEMDSRTFIKRLRTSPVLPKTAAPPPALYSPIFREAAEQGDSAIVICPSADVSGTYRSVKVAAQEFPNADIRIIDSRLVAGGLGSVVIEALKWAKAGLTADAVVSNIQEMAKREKVYFAVDTLEYLYKGGRIGAAKALFGSLLQVKPILTFLDGVTTPFESQRTHKRALARVKEMILADCPCDSSAHLCVMHGDAEEECQQLAVELSGLLGIPAAEIPIYDLPPAILVHAGPGIIGASFFVSK
jgi:DegV family protein with EDD domain